MIKIFNRDNLDRIVEEVKSIYYKIRSVGYSFKDTKKMTLDFIDSIELDLGRLNI